MLRAACAATQRAFLPVDMAVGGELPHEVARVDGPVVFHGRTSLVLAASRSRPTSGVFYSPSTFCHAAFVQHLGRRYLNHDAQLLRAADVPSRLEAIGGYAFVKPGDDLKGFSGLLVRSADDRRLVEKLMRDPEQPVLISRAREVDAEWRLFVLDGRVITGSMYRPYAERKLPAELERFASEVAGAWSPAVAFALDVGRVDGDWTVIECTCCNWSRFYEADVAAWVEALSAHQERVWC